MPLVALTLPLAYLFLRCDTLNALALSPSAPLPYVYALIYTASVQALQSASNPARAEARTQSRLVASLNMTGRFALRLRERGGPDAPVRVPCDGCGLRPADTTRGALLAGAPALCECCAPTEPDPGGGAAAAGAPCFDVVDFGDRGVRIPAGLHTCDDACELCPAARAELDALADERTLEAMASMEATEGAFDLFLDTLSVDRSLDQQLPCEHGYAAMGACA